MNQTSIFLLSLMARSMKCTVFMGWRKSDTCLALFSEGFHYSDCRKSGPAISRFHMCRLDWKRMTFVTYANIEIYGDYTSYQEA